MQKANGDNPVKDVGCRKTYQQLEWHIVHELERQYHEAWEHNP